MTSKNATQGRTEPFWGELKGYLGKNFFGKGTGKRFPNRGGLGFTGGPGCPPGMARDRQADPGSLATLVHSPCGSPGEQCATHCAIARLSLLERKKLKKIFRYGNIIDNQPAARLNAGMKTIAVFALKGGVGKTTITANLFAALQNEGKSVSLIDADSQQSLAAWASFSEISCLSTFPGQLPERVAGLKTDFCLIDCPPRITQAFREVVAVANFMLIPLRPSGPDYWAFADFSERIKIPAGVVLNLANPRPSKGEKEFLSAFQSEFPGFPVLGRLAQRNAYSDSIGEGQTVFETGNSAAISEVLMLAESLQEIL